MDQSLFLEFKIKTQILYLIRTLVEEGARVLHAIRAAV